MSHKRNQQQKGRKQNSQKSNDEMSQIQNNNGQHIGQQKQEEEESKSNCASTNQPVNNPEFQSMRNSSIESQLGVISNDSQQREYQRQNAQQQNEQQIEQHENWKETSQIVQKQSNQFVNQQQPNKSQNNIINNDSIPQLIVGSTQKVERKGILKNAQVVYQTEPLKAPLPVSTALFKNQKDIIQIDKLQHLQQQQLNHAHNHNQHHNHHHHYINQQIPIKDNQTIDEHDSNQLLGQNHFSINIQDNPDNALNIYTKIHSAAIPKHLNAAQPTLCRKEGLRSNQKIQVYVDQYIQSKLAKKQAQLLAGGEQIENINFQQNNISPQQLKHISNKINRLEEYYQEDQDEDEEVEDDEDYELYEEFEEDEDEMEEDDEENEGIEEEIDEEEEEGENDIKNSGINHRKFQFSEKRDIDGLRKKRIAMCKDRQNNTIILNIKAQQKYFEGENQLLSSQKIDYNQNQCVLKYNNNTNQGEIVTVTPSSTYSSSSSSTISNYKEGILASQILKDKQNKKQIQQELKMQQHSLQIQKQIESINKMQADAQEFKRQIQLQHQQNLLKTQQQLQSPSNHNINNETNNSKTNKIQTHISPQLEANTIKALSQKTKNVEQNLVKAQPDNQNQQRSQQKILFSQEIKNIFDFTYFISIEQQLDLLEYSEKKRATMVREQEFNIEMQNMIDCVGCKESLHQFLNDLIYNQKQTNLDGIQISKSKEIVIHDSFLENNFNIASFLQFHQNKQSMLENLNKNFSLFKKSIGQRNYRCHLHSKKPIPCLWKDNFEQLFDPEYCSKNEIIEIDESIFLQNLDKYLKKRKFCGTCKENIMGEYQKLKQNVEMNQEEDQYAHHGDYDHMVNVEYENLQGVNPQYYTNEQTNFDHHQAQQCQSHHHHENEEWYQEGIAISQDQIQEHIHDEDCIAHAEEQVENGNLGEDDDQEYEDEVDEEEEEEEEDEEDEVDLDDEQYDLINCIKYCNKTRKISIPMEVGFIQEIMSKAQIDTSLVKHANTTEAAQDELLICLGQTLKDKLQTIWKNKKSEEIVKQLFLNICFRIFMTQLQGYIQMAMERQGCKNSLEEYLEEDERAKEAKKLKNQKKKLKQKIKKQGKKQEEQKKQIEEELKKKQEEELKQKQKQEARQLKKQQEELLQKQKQLEEEQKKIKQQEQKKKKKGKKGSVQDQVQQQNQESELQEDDDEIQIDYIDSNGKQSYAEASPINKAIKENQSNENSYLKNSGTASTTAECLSTINQYYNSQAAADVDSDSSIEIQKQQSTKKSNSLEPELKAGQKQNSKRTKSHQQQQQKEEKANASPQSSVAVAAAAAAGVYNQQNLKSTNQNNLTSSQLKQIERAKESEPSSNTINKSTSNCIAKFNSINILDGITSNITIQEREIRLLKSMGWNEEHELIIEIPQTDINHYSKNKKKYDKERASYRKTLHERFLSIINKQKNLV